MKFINAIPKSNVAHGFLKDKEYEISIRDLVSYLKNFPIQQINISSLDHLKTWDDFENITVMKKGHWIKFNDLGSKNQDKHKKKIEKDVMKTDIRYPIIVIVNNGKVDAILDGNHRVQKAKLLGVKSLPAHILGNEDIEKYLETKNVL